MKRLLIAALAICLAPLGASAQESVWLGTWGASPTPPFAASRSFEDVTLRQVVRLSAGGELIRVRFTNEYGEAPLTIGAASIGDGDNFIPLTFSGAAGAKIPAGAPYYSDPVALPAALEAGADLTINIYLPEATGPCTCHPVASATTAVSEAGNHILSAFEPADTFVNRAFISGVEVEGGISRAALATDGPLPQRPRVIVTFGDSITDGTNSTPDTNNRWPNVLAERLNEGPWARYGVVNMAISGNQVLTTGRLFFGEAALLRFDRDVLSVPGLTHVVILEGINDLGMNPTARPTAEDLIAGYRQLIGRARGHGVKVIGATLLPYEGAAYFSEEGETQRQAVNAWIRTSGEFDGVIDFDALMRDPANPRRLIEAEQSGDWLHPNDAGYRKMGEAVNLDLFQ